MKTSKTLFALCAILILVVGILLVTNGKSHAEWNSIAKRLEQGELFELTSDQVLKYASRLPKKNAWLYCYDGRYQVVPGSGPLNWTASVEDGRFCLHDEAGILQYSMAGFKERATTFDLIGVDFIIALPNPLKGTTEMLEGNQLSVVDRAKLNEWLADAIEYDSRRLTTYKGI